MRSCWCHSLARLAFIGLLFVALAGGSGMRPVPSEIELRLEAWVMAGGTLDDLCSDHGVAQGDKAHCPLCNLAAPIVLPSIIASLIDIERRILAHAVLPQMRRAAGHTRDPAIPKRGPPIPT